MKNIFNSLIKIIDNKIRKHTELTQDIIKQKKAIVLSYDTNTYIAYVRFQDDENNNIHKYYNKSGEKLAENDIVDVYYTTNIDKGWIGCKCGMCSRISKDDINRKIIIQKKKPLYYKAVYDDECYEKQYLNTGGGIEGGCAYVNGSPIYKDFPSINICLIEMGVKFDDANGIGVYTGDKLESLSVDLYMADGSIKTTKYEFIQDISTYEDVNGTYMFYLYIDGVKQTYSSRFKQFLYFETICTKISLKEIKYEEGMEYDAYTYLYEAECSFRCYGINSAGNLGWTSTWSLSVDGVPRKIPVPENEILVSTWTTIHNISQTLLPMNSIDENDLANNQQ